MGVLVVDDRGVVAAVDVAAVRAHARHQIHLHPRGQAVGAGRHVRVVEVGAVGEAAIGVGAVERLGLDRVAAGALPARVGDLEVAGRLGEADRVRVQPVVEVVDEVEELRRVLAHVRLPAVGDARVPRAREVDRAVDEEAVVVEAASASSSSCCRSTAGPRRPPPGCCRRAGRSRCGRCCPRGSSRWRPATRGREVAGRGDAGVVERDRAGEVVPGEPVAKSTVFCAAQHGAGLRVDHVVVDLGRGLPRRAGATPAAGRRGR